MILNSLAFLQGQDLLIVLVVVLVLFGGKKIPELMRGVGKGMGELQKGLEEGKQAIYKAPEEPEAPKPTTTSTPTP